MVGASVVLGGLALVGLLLALGLSIGMVVRRGLARVAARPRPRPASAVSLAPIGEGVDLDAAAGAERARAVRLRRLRGRRRPSSPSRSPTPGAGRRAAPGRRPTPRSRSPTSEDPSGQLVIELGDDARAAHGPWKLPPANVLKRGSGKEADRRLVEEGGRILEATLAHHGVDARLVGTTVGPTVTRYELELAPGVKVNRVTGLSHDIAYAMASPDVRILAPIPGRSAIGVEVPNKERQLVTLGDILASPEAKAGDAPARGRARPRHRRARR